MIPKNLLKWKNELDILVDEVKSEYLISVKKAIIDFVLEDTAQKKMKKVELTPARLEVKEMAFRWRHKFNENRRVIGNILFSINPCLAQTLEIWHVNFKNLTLVNVDILATKREAYEMAEFTVII